VDGRWGEDGGTDEDGRRMSGKACVSRRELGVGARGHDCKSPSKKTVLQKPSEGCSDTILDPSPSPPTPNTQFRISRALYRRVTLIDIGAELYRNYIRALPRIHVRSEISGSIYGARDLRTYVCSRECSYIVSPRPLGCLCNSFLAMPCAIVTPCSSPTPFSASIPGHVPTRDVYNLLLLSRLFGGCPRTAGGADIRASGAAVTLLLLLRLLARFGVLSVRGFARFRFKESGQDLRWFQTYCIGTCATCIFTCDVTQSGPIRVRTGLQHGPGVVASGILHVQP
jgi:hypothetical protein